MSFMCSLFALCFFVSQPVTAPTAPSLDQNMASDFVAQIMASEDAGIQDILAELTDKNPNFTVDDLMFALRKVQVNFDYFFDPAKTSFAGYRTRLCNDQIIQYGTVTPYFNFSAQPCN